MSLSRFQLVLWTIVVLSAFGIAAVYNTSNASRASEDDPLKDDPLNIQVPPEVWGLLGISVASLTSSEIIKQQNQGKGSAPNAPAVKKSPKDASLFDLFSGETEGSEKYLEVGKVQMFFFTLIVVYAYGTAIAAEMFSNTGRHK